MIETIKNQSSLKEGDKIYYLDYEESGSSYTVCGVFFKKNNDLCKGGLCYNIHSDSLSQMTGYYELLDSEVDDPKGRFFSSPERAHDVYVKFLDLRTQKNQNTKKSEHNDIER